MGDGIAEERFARLEAALAAQQSQLDGLIAENERLRRDASGPSDPSSATVAEGLPRLEAPGSVGRRTLMAKGLAAAGAAAAGAVLLDGRPAAAANGGALVMGSTTNSSTLATSWNVGSAGVSINGTSTDSTLSVSGTSISNPCITAYNGSAGGWGIRAITAGTSVAGLSFGGTGVFGESDSRAGVQGLSRDGNGVAGSTNRGYGVHGEAQAGTGVVGSGHNGVSGIATGVAGHGVVGGNTLPGGTGAGVLALATSGAGVDASSQTGTAIKATSTSGTALRLEARVPVDLVPQVGPPTSGDHTAGQMWMEGDAIDGTLWLCVSSGSPGLWRKVGGLATSGALHVLPAPARVYDSRRSTAPNVGPKTPFVARETRTFDLKANSSGVPAGASAALVTLLLVNAAEGAGNMTIWANGVAKPLANSVVWGGSAGRFTATALTALDAAGRVQVNSSAPTDLVIDVVGYYR